MSRTEPLVITPSQRKALRIAACTSPMVEAPLAAASRSWKTAMRGTGSSPIVSHQSVRSTYALPDIGGSADRTRQVAAYPRMRGEPPVTHCKPGRVNPSLRSRTRKCSMALAIVQVSNCRMASKIAGESGWTVVVADTALCFVRENGILLWLDNLRVEA